MTSPFFHLLPRGRAFRVFHGTNMRGFFQGLFDGLLRVKLYADNSLLDLFPETTRELAEQEHQFGLTPPGFEPFDRVARLAKQWKSAETMTLAEIQSWLDAYGWGHVRVYPYWGEAVDYQPLDPRDYADAVFYGTTQCVIDTEDLAPRCGAQDFQCDQLPAGGDNYWTNATTFPLAPPLLSDTALWPRCLYFASQASIDEPAFFPVEALPEFKRMVQRIKPAEAIVITNFVADWTLSAGTSISEVGVAADWDFLSDGSDFTWATKIAPTEDGTGRVVFSTYAEDPLAGCVCIVSALNRLRFSALSTAGDGLGVGGVLHYDIATLVNSLIAGHTYSLVVTRAGGDIEVFIDRVLVELEAEGQPEGTGSNAAQPLRIWEDESQPFTGGSAGQWFWDSALDATQRDALFDFLEAQPLVAVT